MQLNDDLHVLELPMVRDGETRILNLSLVLDPVQGATLVDTGLPGQRDLIAAALAEAGGSRGRARRRRRTWRPRPAPCASWPSWTWPRSPATTAAPSPRTRAASCDGWQTSSRRKSVPSDYC